MRRVLSAVLVIVVPALVIPTAAIAQSPFDGTWKVDLNSEKAHVTEKYMLRNGEFECLSCVPKITVKADGQEHEIAGNGDFDKFGVHAIDDHTVEETWSLGGKEAGHDKITVGEDGLMKDEWTVISTSGEKSNGTDLYKRVGETPAGANKISGTWQLHKSEDYSSNATSLTYHMTPDTLSLKMGTGESFTAKLDGKFYPFNNDPSGTEVSIRKIDANTFEQTARRKGKVVAIYRISVNPDGRTMKIHTEDKEHNATYDWVANKES